MKINPFIYIVVGILILGGFFVFIKNQSMQSQPINTDQISTESAIPSNQKTVLLVIEKNKLVSGSETLKVIEGSEVLIKVMSDESVALHLHGYDKDLNLEKDKEVELKFIADLTGRFPIELHTEPEHTEIGALEVMPK